MPDTLTSLFISKINAVMKENTPESYRFVVCDSQSIVGSGVGGFAREAIDPPALPAKLDDRLNICSMSKMVTATAVLALLQAKNLTPDTLVAPFLPPDWKLSDEVRKLTFKDFMTHHTGFHWEEGEGKPKQDGTSFADIKAILGQKPFNPIKTIYSYRNINLAIFRIVLPYLDAYDRFAKKVNPIGLSQSDQGLAARYVEIVNNVVLKPSGIANGSCNSKTLALPAGPNGRPPPIGSNVAVLAYHYKKPGQRGIDIGDQTLWSGAEGWCLSVVEVARILQTILYTEVILSEKSRAYMAVSQVGAGCGMNLDKLKKGSLVHSHGAWIPFETNAPPDGAQLAGWFMCYDKVRLIVVALSNSGHDPNVIANQGNWDTRVNDAFESLFA